jgi:aspartate dehydrogenase
MNIHSGKPLAFTLVGFGAIGRTLVDRSAALPGMRLSHVVVRPRRVAETQAALTAMGHAAQAIDHVPEGARLLLECAGHAALEDHVLPALTRGVESAVVSVGALAEPGLPERLADAAARGNTHLHLLSGAIGGIDALAAARLGGLGTVVYTGRKPPSGWKGSAAEAELDLAMLTQAATFFEGSAREAARQYPKNANVAATLSLAGVGLDATRVRLIADPGVSENIHEVEARGAFGDFRLVMRGKPLADNPKTSALTVLSALRFLHNRTAPLCI